MSDSNEIKPFLTNEETKQAIDALKPEPFTKTVDVAPKAEKPIEVKPTEPAKEVKPVAEVKDPKGMFDYTGCEQYTVQDGETLFDVAQKYKIALQQLRYFNHVPKDTMRVKPKQTLYIPKEPVFVPTGK
ncbi:LysM peptidoglycan-binding domain-containing protein [Lactobacillus crispatus]|uniref:LysM peptidoglycan-binding domain-containing protein n=1 Tax=Lactobacillus crispatus TaxID=47770 RepID=UPI001ABEB955|nr:LysM domain-containing protein [Lactobacillus crispatus]MBO4165887.1 LysM peptidoglycan-binding domain-containing protein [Lactobacillus crispatus]